MNDTAFIELAIKYLDAAADADEVEKLNAAMLDHPERRAIYRELVQQSQLAHEWQSSSFTPNKTRPISTLAVFAALAAAIILSLFAVRLFQKGKTIPSDLVEKGTEPFDFFKGEGPSWLAIYPSVFDRPDFVWRSEFSTDASAPESPDIFTESGIPAALAATLAPEFRQRIEPIVMLPGGLY